jgi:Icc protein
MPNTGQYVSILHITDPHILPDPVDRLLGVDTAHYLEAVLTDALNAGHAFDLCLITGDLAQDPDAASYERLLGILQNHNISFTCLPGNHDDYALMEKFLKRGKINCNKRIVLENWQIVCLNSQITGSAAGNLSNEELTFLSDCLKNNPGLHSLIAVHHHCVPTGSLWMDSMIIKNSDAFFAAIRAYPQVKAIINGHIHQEMDLNVNGVRIMTTPSTCFQFKPGSEEFSLDATAPGYRWLQLYDDGVISTGVIRLSEALRGLQITTKGY